MRYIGIETFNPATVTYPPEVKKILIVNNAASQPSDTGYDTDSALYSACRSLGNAIAETGFFQDALLFHENTRTDTLFLIDRKLTQNQVASLCEETGADAVIAFDRLLFNMNRVVSKTLGEYVLGMIDMKITGVVRSYLPSRENPQLSILFEDSIFWTEEAPSLTVLDQLLPTTGDALTEAGAYIGSKLYAVFVPHWDKDTRWYYTGAGSRWKEASSFAAGEKWENALERWTYLYERTSNVKNKAKLASNIALYHELNSDMTQAGQWAEKSYELLNQNRPANDNLIKLQEVYKNQIQERIQAGKKLNLQFGDE
jgi:hypothetical protein